MANRTVRSLWLAAVASNMGTWIADIVDRRRLLIAVNVAMIVIAALLASCAWWEMVDANAPLADFEAVLSED